MGNSAVGGQSLAVRGLEPPEPYGSQWSSTLGAPLVTVSAVGTSSGYPRNDGADFGPDTAGTNTDGLAEACASGRNLQYVQPVVLLPGTFTLNASLQCYNAFLIASGWDTIVQGGPVTMSSAMLSWSGTPPAGTPETTWYNVGLTGVRVRPENATLQAEMIRFDNSNGGAQDVIVDSNFIVGAPNDGILLTNSGGVYCTGDITRNAFEGCGGTNSYAVNLQNSFRSCVYGNRFQGSNGRCVHVGTNGTGGSNGTSVFGNFMYQSETGHIWVDASSYVSIYGNTLIDPSLSTPGGKPTIVVENGSTYVHIFGNTGLSDSSGWPSYQVGIEDTSDYVFVHDNLLYGWANGFVSYGSGTHNSVWSNPPYAPGWVITTPSVPAGTGSTNKVVNTFPFPVRVYAVGASGGHIIDPSGTDKALGVDPAEFTLDPGAAYYVATTAPSSWLWYGT